MDTQADYHEGQTPIEQTENDQPTSKSSRRNNKPMAASATADDIKNGNGGIPQTEKSRERKIGLLPTAISENGVSYQGKVVGETTWANLPGRSLFSASADGSHPYVKLSKSSYMDLVTEEVTTSVPPKSQQKLYRVKLQ